MRRIECGCVVRPGGPLILAIDEQEEADVLVQAISAAANAAIGEATRGMALCR